jgi:beta-lactamase regulating signal transducer with metallopeptidase domain
MPAWEKPLWTIAARRESGNEVTVALNFAPGAHLSAAVRPPENAPGTSLKQRGPWWQPSTQVSGRFNVAWWLVASGIWFAGLLVVLVPPLIGLVRLRALRRRARLLDREDWILLLAELCRDLRLRRRVALLQAGDAVMPVTWGWHHPVILLPGGAEEWSEERRRVVLLHELGHVKRWDCLTQMLARVVCAIYWFNPLAWLAARRMCIERERACDDLVLNSGRAPSDYAGHLLEIARSFRHFRQLEAIAMARPSQIQNRIVAIVDASRTRRLPRGWWVALGCVAFVGLVTELAAQKSIQDAEVSAEQATHWWDGRLRAFFAAKAQQARKLAEQENKPKLAPEIWPYFEAGIKGDWKTATNLWVTMRARAHQYENTIPDETMDSVVWSPILETDLAWEQFANWQQKYVLAYGNDIIKSIPTGSIYFGGTDPGRGVITVMSKSHADGDPFFTITQNALADGLYLDYVRLMYGAKIYTPTSDDSMKSFAEYVGDARRRLDDHKLKPGEDVKVSNGKVQVQGQVAVMAVNALIARIIFDKNPGREFYIEESFPLDWMYPHLLPNGLIMKINREPLTVLSEDIVRQDQEYWSSYLKPIIGDWLTAETKVQQVADFIEKVYRDHDFSGFTGDPDFIRDNWSQKAFSKLRSSIAGVYAWRATQSKDAAERQRMIAEADFAFRQALALCPNSPEAVFRYVNLLLGANRAADAGLVAATAVKLTPDDSAGVQTQFRGLLEQIQTFEKTSPDKK